MNQGTCREEASLAQERTAFWCLTLRGYQGPVSVTEKSGHTHRGTSSLSPLRAWAQNGKGREALERGVTSPVSPSSPHACPRHLNPKLLGP